MEVGGRNDGTKPKQGRWSEPPLGACSDFQMIKTVSVETDIGDGGGCSAGSR
jgi:hypothetical protein